MQKSSKFRLFLAGLTAAALIGGVMAADPADAGKKKKKRAKAKSSKVVQVSKGGKAKAGNGGNGGKGGKSGNVYNTGNVGGGFVLQPVPGSDARACAEAALAGFEGDTGGTDYSANDVINALVPECFPGPGGSNIPGNLQGCLVSQGAGADSPLTGAEIEDCLDDAGVDPGDPIMILVPAGSGSVHSGNGGSGGEGGTGGNATGGAAGDNSNSSSTTVNRDDHSIDVD